VFRGPPDGFLRAPEHTSSPGPDDVYSHRNTRFDLRTGDTVSADPPASEGERYFALIKGGRDQLSRRESRNKIFSTTRRRRVRRSGSARHQTTTGRVMDTWLIGKGQRAFDRRPPRTGKTMLLQSIITHHDQSS
jgi:transcription termination factor Rho